MVLTHHQGLIFLHGSLQAGRLGVHRELGGNTAQTTNAQEPKGYPRPHHFVLRNKSWGKEEEGGMSGVTCLSSQVIATRDGALLSWRWLNSCPPLGSGGWISCFALFVCTSFALPIKLSLSRSTSFFAFALPILSPLHGGRNQAAVWSRSASWQQAIKIIGY